MNALTGLIAEGLVSEGVPLGPLTTYKAGGPARLFAAVRTRADLGRLIESGVTRSHSILVLGRGSNLVVADEGYDGLVIQLGGEFTTIHFEDLEVEAGAAVPLPRLARAASDQGITGLEFFVGVPGSVGGAVRQNAGCFGSETRDCLVTAEVIDLLEGGISRLTAGDLELGYRHSNLKAEQLVARARFVGSRGDVVASSERMREITRWRRDNQPGGTLNAGSVFKNPEGTTAGELIDQLGLKGMAVGEVAVSEKHANFIVAGPGARAEDIRNLVDLVKDRVFESTGTILEPEIQFVGFER